MIDLLHRIAAVPWVYDTIQYALGLSYIQQRVLQHVQQMSTPGQVVDIGAGTGLWRTMWTPEYRYLCLDIDMQKLEGFASKYSTREVLQGDAAKLPFKSNSVEIVVCISVAHHLETPPFDSMLSEIQRVLKKGGKLLFFDPLWTKQRLPSRILWKLDRGSNPRTPQTLEMMLHQHFTIQKLEYFAVYHRYLLATCTK